MRPTDEAAPRRRLLMVADVQTGYHHDAISCALAVVERLGRASGAYEATLRTDSQLITRTPILGQGAKYGGKRVNARNLNDFDALFLMPSGSGTLSEAQKEDLLAFVRDEGKGLIVGHAATVGFFDWPEFGALIGGRLGGEVEVAGEIEVEDAGFPGAMAFGTTRFTYYEQHPILKEPYRREDVHVVMRLDPACLTPEQRARRPDGDLPVVWTRRYGAGRVYSAAWGHMAATWEDPRFQAMLLGGIRWAMGDDGT